MQQQKTVILSLSKDRPNPFHHLLSPEFCLLTTALSQLMFPNPEDAPSEFAQLAVHAAVTGFVRGKFLFPECTIASGHFAMLRATVPETAVHKECQPIPPKKKIRFAENFLIPPPAGDTVAA